MYNNKKNNLVKFIEKYKSIEIKVNCLIKAIYYFILIINIILINLVSTHSQELNFGFLTGSNGSDYGRDLALDSENNILMVGTFTNTVNFDMKGNNYNLTTAGGAGFVSKYKQNGDILWAFDIQSVDIYDIEIDNFNNFYILVNIVVNTEVNPLGNSVILNSIDGPLFVIKYDKDGHYINHVGSITIAGGTRASMTIDKLNNIFVFSSTTFSFDIDPTSNVKILSHNGAIDWFVSKYNSNLVFQNAIILGGTGNEYSGSVKVDDNLNIYVTGGFQNTVDFDPSGNINNMTSTDGIDGFIVKFDKDFNYIYSKQFSGTNNQIVRDIEFYNNEIYLIGDFVNSIDTDPGSGFNIFSVQAPQSGNDIWFGKYKSSDGSLIVSWHLEGGGIFASLGYKIKIDEWGYIYIGLTGWGNVDFDPSPNQNIKNMALYEIGFAKYTNNAELVWYGIIEGGEIDAIANFVIDSDYNLVATGNVRSNPVNFDIMGGTNLSPTILNENIVIVSYKLKVPPKLNIIELSKISTNNFSIKFKLINNGNSNILKIGILLKENSTPTINDYDYKFEYNKDSVLFSENVKNLYSNAKYHIILFAQNDEYFGFSDEIIITTLPTEEDLAPNNGDGNNDGILDSRQKEVLSIKTTNEKYITIEEINGLEIYDGEIFKQREVTSKYYFSFGEVGFKIDSSYARIKMYFEGINDFSSYVFRKRLSNEKYTNLTLLKSGIDTIAGNPTAYIEFELFDGSPFDNDGLTNGIIYDPGGPALVIVEENISTLSEYARIILLSSFALFGVLWNRKKFIN